MLCGYMLLGSMCFVVCVVLCVIVLYCLIICVWFDVFGSRLLVICYCWFYVRWLYACGYMCLVIYCVRSMI